MESKGRYVRVCSITHHQVVDNPRLYREAEALVQAGHEVRVVSVQHTPGMDRLDQELARRGGWRLQSINIERSPEGRWNWFRTGIRKKAAKHFWKMGARGKRLAGFAYTRTFSETIRAVLSEPADWIIAHTQPMLAPAYFAARRAGCAWSFDCEDILSEEYGEGIQDPSHQTLVRYVEKTFIPRASFVTAASGPFQRWLVENCGLSPYSVLVRNVPSAKDAPRGAAPGYPESRKRLLLYWFSQSIGPLRGIEDVLRALPRVEVPVELHLRGEVLPEFQETLDRLIQELGVREKVFIHPRIPPHELLKAAAQHDIGLALMQPCCLNHELAVPNKIYFYMMAGLAVIATSTKGHQSAMAEADGAGFMYRPGDFEDLADRINFLAKSPGKLWDCRKRAFELARTRFNWETERKKIVELVEKLRK
ncbi:MAG: glycosyltransferase [Candidatus Omnitrophica bacterium]|nr:glycosyltransferase [Candidatus Omnitrophota bacterium]